MTSREGHSARYVALAFVGLSATASLNMLWNVGTGVRDTLLAFGPSVLAPTYFAIHSRKELSAVVLGSLVLAIGLHRHRSAVSLLVILGCLELTIAVCYLFAMWLTLRELV